MPSQQTRRVPLDPLLTRGERLQIVQREIEANAKRTMPGPSLAVCIVDAIRDAEAAAKTGEQKP